MTGNSKVANIYSHKYHPIMPNIPKSITTAAVITFHISNTIISSYFYIYSVFVGTVNAHAPTTFKKNAR
jgi:hypothetical protein